MFHFIYFVCASLWRLQEKHEGAPGRITLCAWWGFFSSRPSLVVVACHEPGFPSILGMFSFVKTERPGLGSRCHVCPLVCVSCGSAFLVLFPDWKYIPPLPPFLINEVRAFVNCCPSLRAITPCTRSIRMEGVRKLYVVELVDEPSSTRK